MAIQVVEHGNRMNDPSAITEIDPASWQVKLLPLPKRYSRGVVTGFCNGYAAGVVESTRARISACWWPDGLPELLSLKDCKDPTAGSANGTIIPGHWRKGSEGAMRAVMWRLTEGQLSGCELHDETYDQTWTTAAGGGVVVGVGVPTGKMGSKSHDVGLVWNGAEAPTVLSASGDVLLLVTDGTRVAGSIGGRAALWSNSTAQPINLATDQMPASEVRVLDAEIQAGTAFKRFCARAVLWRGSVESFCDITPSGYQTGRIYGGTRGYQVGFVREKDTTKNGSTGIDNRAMLWHSAADKCFDLNSLLPSNSYNASIAHSIEITGSKVQIGGQVSRYEVTDAGTACLNR